MMKDNRLWVLISRRLSGEASISEAEELQQLLEQSPDKQYLIEILHAYFTPPPADIAQKEPGGDVLEERFLKVIEKSEADLGRGRKAPIFSLPFRRIAILAAIIIPLLGIMIFLMRPAAGPPSVIVPAAGGQTGEIFSKAGARTKLVLPDGTKVWLNSSSKLRYARLTEGPTREVELEGEAFFDVAKDAQRPFIVHADSLEIKVLGTEFTVKSYPQDPTIEATLLKGAIEITRKGNPNTPHVILKPNEKLVFNRHLSPAPILSPDPTSRRSLPAPPDIAVNSIPRNIPDSEKVETGWMYNRLVFDGDSFKELSEKMERWYNVKIIFKDTRLYKHRFGGSFDHETIEEALNALQLTAGFTYKIKGNEIELYEE
jgi:transmembrane sensor